MTLRRLLPVALLLAIAVSSCTLETTGAVKGDQRFFSRFDDVQELVIGHTVRISDVNIGTVLGIELDGYEAVVEFTIENGRTLPEGTTASISVTSLLGENYVALQLPDDPASKPALESGATVPSGAALATIEEVAVELLALTRAIQGRDVAAIVEAGAVGIGPRGDDLNRLVRTLGSVTGGFAAQAATLDALLTDLDGLVSSLADDASALGQTIDLAADATGALATQRERVVATVEDLTALATAVDREVLAPHRERLTQIIADLQPVVSTVVDEQDTLLRAVSQLVIVTERLPASIHAGAIVSYAWVDEFTFGDDGMQTSDFGTALGEILLGVPTP